MSGLNFNAPLSEYRVRAIVCRYQARRQGRPGADLATIARVWERFADIVERSEPEQAPRSDQSEGEAFCSYERPERTMTSTMARDLVWSTQTVVAAGVEALQEMLQSVLAKQEKLLSTPPAEDGMQTFFLYARRSTTPKEFSRITAPALPTGLILLHGEPDDMTDYLTRPA